MWTHYDDNFTNIIIIIRVLEERTIETKKKQKEKPKKRNSKIGFDYQSQFIMIATLLQK